MPTDPNDWAQAAMAAIAGAVDLRELQGIKHRLSLLSREAEAAEATVGAVELRKLGLKDFLARYAGAQESPAPEPTQAPVLKPTTPGKGKPGSAMSKRKPAAKKSSRRGKPLKGPASREEVRAALQSAGKSGLTVAQLIGAVGGKTVKAALALLPHEGFGTGRGMGRSIRLIGPTAKKKV